MSVVSNEGKLRLGVAVGALSFPLNHSLAEKGKINWWQKMTAFKRVPEQITSCKEIAPLIDVAKCTISCSTSAPPRHELIPVLNLNAVSIIILTSVLDGE
jgi:hypothetical protein